MSFSTQDTIVAIATPSGRGGIGVVRISGPEAVSIAQRLITHHGVLEPRYATLTKFRQTGAAYMPETREDAVATMGSPTTGLGGAAHANAIDHVVVTYFPAPASYTGDDVVE